MSHILNENLKRFEPIDSKCVFCNKGYSEKMDDNCFIPLYKENGRTVEGGYRKVKYRELSLGASRCPKCKQIHKLAILSSWLLGILIIICIIGILKYCHYLFDANGWFGLLSGVAILSVVFGFFPLLRVFERHFSRKKGVLYRRDGLKKYDIVQSLITEGWVFEQPTA